MVLVGYDERLVVLFVVGLVFKGVSLGVLVVVVVLCVWRVVLKKVCGIFGVVFVIVWDVIVVNCLEVRLDVCWRYFW